MTDQDPNPAEQPAPPDSPQPAETALKHEEILHNAFMLGWQITELKSRIQVALFETNDFSLRLASIWRALFNRITVLQLKAFPASATTETLYEPPDKFSLPYLYPPAPDYANIGIPEKDATGSVILADFKLYEVTRRAINTLTLLYVKEEDSLVPDLIRKHKSHLVRAILAAAKDPGSGGGEEIAIEGTAPSQNDLQKAIRILTERADKFLEAWDGYLRENFYAGGQLPNDESELASYEAGRSISLLSWGITVATVPLEQQQCLENAPDLTDQFIAAWQYVFRDQVVIRIQHQISTLSAVLDNLYCVRSGTKRIQDDQTGMTNPDLPSQTIRAVKSSLEYWHRTVGWLSKPENRTKLRNKEAANCMVWSKPMRLALIDQANIWQTLIVGQQSLRAFNMESITAKFMQDITDEIQKNLQTDFKGSVHKATQVIKDMKAEAKEAISVAGAAAIDGLEALFKACGRLFWPVLAVVVVIIVGFLIVALVSPEVRSAALGASGSAGVTGVISLVLGYFGLGNLKGIKEQQKTVISNKETTAIAKVETQAGAGEDAAGKSPDGESNIMHRLEGAARDTGKAILEAFDRGYKQIRIELTDLNHSAAVSYPLVEFFVVTFTLKSDEEFLTEIIWSGKERSEEIRRVTSAAFGPLAVFISPLIDAKR